MSFPFLSDLVRDTTGLDLPLPIPMFGLMVACAALIGLWFAGREFERLHLGRPLGMVPDNSNASVPRDLVGELGVIVVLAGIVGARVFSIFESFDDFLAAPWDAIFSRNGFTYYGGLIFGTIAGAIFVKRKSLPIRTVLDAVAPTVMIGYAIGRIGCQLSGDGDWGIVANIAAKPTWLPMWLWAQTYEHNIVGVVIAAPGVYPTPLYETAMSLVAFAMLWGVRKHKHAPGWLFSFFLLLSGIDRFAIELIRVNITVSFFGIDVTQAEIISVVLMVVGIAGLVMLRRSSSPPYQASATN